MKPKCEQCGAVCEGWEDITESEKLPAAFCSKKCVVSHQVKGKRGVTSSN